jgi:hypothetical protein
MPAIDLQVPAAFPAATCLLNWVVHLSELILIESDVSPRYIGIMNMPFDRPLSPGQATELIRRKATAPGLDVDLKRHAKSQMRERDLLMGDVLHLLKNGFVFEEGRPASQEGLFRYKMECTTPNSGHRTVAVIVIPSNANAVKIVTVMWRDEKGTWG